MAWNHPSSSQPKDSKHSTRRPYLLIACIGVGITLVAVWLCTYNQEPNAEPPTKVVSKKQIREHLSDYSIIKPQVPISTTKVVSQKTKTRPPKPSFMDEKPRSEWDSREVAIAYQWYANDPNNRVQGVDMSSRVPPPTFSNLVQEAMAPYLEIGADVLPIGRVSDEEARIAIDTPIDFNYDDPDDLLAKKQGVKEMLSELKQFMKEGRHAQEYFDRLESRQALEYETMQEVRNQVRELEKEGDAEGAIEALEVYNKYLEGKGLPRIHMRIRNK